MNLQAEILIITAADNIMCVFIKKIRLDISCESSIDDSHEMPSLIFPENYKYNLNFDYYNFA